MKRDITDYRQVLFVLLGFLLSRLLIGAGVVFLFADLIAVLIVYLIVQRFKLSI